MRPITLTVNVHVFTWPIFLPKSCFLLRHRKNSNLIYWANFRYIFTLRSVWKEKNHSHVCVASPCSWCGRTLSAAGKEKIVLQRKKGTHTVQDRLLSFSPSPVFHCRILPSRSHFPELRSLSSRRQQDRPPSHFYFFFHRLTSASSLQQFCRFV